MLSDPRTLPRRSAFTLIEVLVVVVIIAILVAVLMPSLSRARAQARNVTCLSNLHQFSISIMAYVNQYKGKIPGNTDPGEEGWAHCVARQFNIRPQFQFDASGRCVLAYIPVETLEVFHCPERSAKTPVPFLDYVHNTLDPAGPDMVAKTWRDAHKTTIEVDKYKRPGDVAFICDAEHDGKVEQGPDVQYPPNPYPSVYMAARKWAMWKQSGQIPWYGIDVMDIRLGAHVPQGWGNINPIGPGNSHVRRAARAMHLDRFTNCMFLDGHAAGVPMATFARSDSDNQNLHQQNFAYWLRLFGLNDPVKAATVSPANW